MRFVLLFLILNSGAILGQNAKSSSRFIQLNEVELVPMFPGCETTDCSFDNITSFITESLQEDLIRSLSPEESVLIIRFIVDSEGKVRSPNIQSKREDLKAAGINILKELPDFTPGVHEGEKVNVIIDIPLKIEIEDPVLHNSDPHVTRPMAVKCKNKKDPKQCTSEVVQHFFNNKFKARNFKTNGEWLKAVIKFTIDKDGKVVNVTAEGGNKDFNEAGIKVIEKLPDFIPGTKDGKNTAVEYSVPFIIMTN